MNNNKGFFAISLIYSFFLVFLALMTTILAQSVNSRVLVGRIKEDIRQDIGDTTGLFKEIIPRGLMVGDTIALASENWMVLKVEEDKYVLILDRALNKKEIVSSIGVSLSAGTASQYYGTCNDDVCRVRTCRNTPSNIEYCYLYTDASGVTREDLRRKPTWKLTLTDTEKNTDNYGTTIVSKVVNTWFDTHQGLQRLVRNKKMVTGATATTPPYINDGTTLGSSNKITGYVRLPYSSELQDLPLLVQNKLNSTIPIHLIDVSGEFRTKFYQAGSVVEKYANQDALIRPVIEVKIDAS